MIPGYLLREAANIKIGTPRLVGVSASGWASGSSKAPWFSGTPHPFAWAAEMGASADQRAACILFRCSRQRVSDKRVFEEWYELASASQHVIADSLLIGRYGRRLRGVSRSFPKGRFRCRTAHSSEDRKVLQSERVERKHSVRVRNGPSLVCPGFALKSCRIW